MLSVFATIMVSLTFICSVQAAEYGIDFSQSVSLSQMQCVHSNGLFISMRVFHDGGGGACDGPGLQALQFAYQAGFSGGIMPYIFPNPVSMVSGAYTPQAQVQGAVYCTGSTGFDGVYWLDIEVDPNNPWPDCGTSSSYILDMIGELAKFNSNVGIYTSRYEWQAVTCQSEETEDGRARTVAFQQKLGNVFEKTRPIREAYMTKHANASKKDPIAERIATNETFKNLYSTPYPGGVNIFLWYAHYDANPSFSDFTPFGPFKSPFAKQYNDNCGWCGINSDCDWCPI